MRIASTWPNSTLMIYLLYTVKAAPCIRVYVRFDVPDFSTDVTALC